MKTGPSKRGISGKWLITYQNGCERVKSKNYAVWHAMKSRCEAGGKEQIKNKNYQGCIMSEEFSDFQKFGDWYEKQIGAEDSRYDLDKDLLFSGNKLYSSETCVLIPRNLNIFLVSQNSTRGKYPQGVCKHKMTGRFQATVNDMGNLKYLGLFDSPEEAFSIYKREKEVIAKKWLKLLEDKVFCVSDLVIERLRNWTVPVEAIDSLVRWQQMREEDEK